MISRISRIEAMVTLLLVDQMARNQNKPPFYSPERLEEDAKGTEEHIENQASAIGKRIVEYMYKEESKPEVRHDRRRKWSGWEI